MVCSPHSPHAVDVVFALVGQRHVDDVGQALDVDAPRGDVGADQEAHVPVLEGLQVAPPLLHGPSTPEHHARVRVLLPALRLAREGAATAEVVEELLEVVTVEVGATKHEALLHAVLLDKAVEDPLLEALGRLGPALPGPYVRADLVKHVAVVRVRPGLPLQPGAVFPGVDNNAGMVHRFGDEVLPFEVDPDGMLAEAPRHVTDFGGVESGAEHEDLQRGAEGDESGAEYEDLRVILVSALEGKELMTATGRGVNDEGEIEAEI